MATRRWIATTLAVALIPALPRLAAAQPSAVAPGTPPSSQTAANPFAGQHLMIVVAHQDDETLGAGIAIAAAKRVSVVHTTDGASSEQMGRRLGFSGRAGYAKGRSQEVREALARSGASFEIHELGIWGQDAAFKMSQIAASLRQAIPSIRPDVILTLAFEGGHPDHDATAVAVRLAQRDVAPRTPLYEMSLYNAVHGPTGKLLPHPNSSVIALHLTPEEQARKRLMLGAFASQREGLAKFGVEKEEFRLAPEYEFGVRPHPGRLYYERTGLMAWPVWRVLLWRETLADRGIWMPQALSDHILRLWLRWLLD